MTVAPTPARRLGPVLLAVAAALLAVGWAASGAPSRVPVVAGTPPSPAAGSPFHPGSGSCLASATMDGNPESGTAKEVVESGGIAIPTPWKPVKGAFGRLAAAADSGSAAVEGTSGAAVRIGGIDPETPGSAPGGTLHGPSPPPRRMS